MKHAVKLTGSTAGQEGQNLNQWLPFLSSCFALLLYSLFLSSLPENFCASSPNKTDFPPNATGLINPVSLHPNEVQTTWRRKMVLGFSGRLGNTGKSHEIYRHGSPWVANRKHKHY